MVMSKTFVKYKKQQVLISLSDFITKKRVRDEDESVPFMRKKDLYRDKTLSSSTH